MQLRDPCNYTTPYPTITTTAAIASVTSVELLLVILTSSINILALYLLVLHPIYLQINAISKLGIIILLQNLFYLLF